MDNRDEIIRTQLDVIGTLINSNIRRMSDDLWGSPAPDSKSGKQNEKESPAPEQKVAEDAAEKESEPPEQIEDLKKELDELIGLEGIKREVNNLINMVTVHNLRKQNGLKTVDMSLHMVFFRKSRHRQDDDRAADGTHLQKPGRAVQRSSH